MVIPETILQILLAYFAPSVLPVIGLIYLWRKQKAESAKMNSEAGHESALAKKELAQAEQISISTLITVMESMRDEIDRWGDRYAEQAEKHKDEIASARAFYKGLQVQLDDAIKRIGELSSTEKELEDCETTLGEANQVLIIKSNRIAELVDQLESSLKPDKPKTHGLSG